MSINDLASFLSVPVSMMLVFYRQNHVFHSRFCDNKISKFSYSKKISCIIMSCKEDKSSDLHLAHQYATIKTLMPWPAFVQLCTVDSTASILSLTIPHPLFKRQGHPETGKVVGSSLAHHITDISAAIVRDWEPHSATYHSGISRITCIICIRTIGIARIKGTAVMSGRRHGHFRKSLIINGDL